MTTNEEEAGPRRGQRGRGRGHGRGGSGREPRSRGWTVEELPDAADAAGWFAGRLPDDWFPGGTEVSVDREEVVVTGTLADVDAGDDAAAAAEGRAARFREQTRAERMLIADQAEARYGRTVSWATQVSGQRFSYTRLSVPVMTRLRQPERQVLDTLVASGVARSRSEALAWSVRLVSEHAEDWLSELRVAMTAVDDVRTRGPEL